MLFSQVVGQKEIKQKLIQTVKEKRISHAQLFLGKEGSGNLALALAYAQYISCTNKKENDSCGKCLSCIKYQKLIHPDLHFVFPVIKNAKFKQAISVNFIAQWREIVLENSYFSLKQWQEKIGTENIKPSIYTQESNEIIKTLSLKTFEAEYKIMIIWLPETMNIAASNKLLKILEEPPEKTLFILVAENIDFILQTILSRTQLIKIAKVNNEDLKDFIKDKSLTNDEIDNILHLADGNYLKVLNLIENKDENNFYFEKFASLMRFSYSRKIVEIIAWVDEIAKTGREQQKLFLDYALRMIRENFILNIANQEKSLSFLTSKEKEFSDKFNQFINPKNVFAINHQFNLAYQHISANGNHKLIFLDLACQLITLLKIKKV